MRYKNNSNFTIGPDMSLIYNYGIFLTPKVKNTNYINFYNTNFNISNLLNTNYSIGNLNFFTNNFFSLNLLLKESTGIVTQALNNFWYLFNYENYLDSLSNLKILLSINNNLNTVLTYNKLFIKDSVHYRGVNYNSENILVADNDTLGITKMSELSNNYRYTQYNNPIISYDYKTGNYNGIWENLYPSLMLSYIEVARNIRKSPWFFSDQYTDLLKLTYNNYNIKCTNSINLKLYDTSN